MRLYIVRHAKAEPDSETGRDADRPLRPRGHRQAESLGAFFAAESPSPAMVLSSPYLRARETAEHIWSALDLFPQFDDRLAAERTLDDYLDVLRDLSGAPSAVIVGHNPLVARLVAALLEGPTAPPARHETARVVALDLDPDADLGEATLVDTFRPED
jgi:phosphohistidine phosphatase SixA